MNNLLDLIKARWVGLSEREQRLSLAMLGILVLLPIAFLLYSVTGSISDLSDENEQIAKVLRDLQQSEPKIRKQLDEKRRSDIRFSQATPPLASFLATQGRNAGVSIREVVDQPERTVRNYRRRSVRVSIPAIALKPLVEFMVGIRSSPYPVAVERLQVEHYQSGDSYSVQLTVVAYDRVKPGEGASQDAKKSGGE